MNVRQVNCDLVRALGLDPKDVSRVVLTIDRREVPTIEVTKILRSADGLQTAVEMLRLQQVPVRA